MDIQVTSKDELTKDYLSIMKRGMANFLAGIFIIVTVIGDGISLSDLDLIQLLSIIVGGLLILTGFAVVLGSISTTKLDGYRKWVDKWEPQFVFVFYAVAVTQLFLRINGFYQDNSIILLIVSALFTLLILISIIFMFIRLIRNIRSIILAAFLFDFMSVLTILMSMDKLTQNIYQPITYTTISVILLFIAWIISSKKESKETSEKG